MNNPKLKKRINRFSVKLLGKTVYYHPRVVSHITTIPAGSEVKILSKPVGKNRLIDVQYQQTKHTVFMADLTI